MVKNFWKQITVVCGNHEDNEEVLMDWKEGHRSLFYSCPKYYPENREPGERACKNNVSLDDFEKIVEKLSSEIEESMMSGQKINLQNYSFKVKSIEITVLKHTDDSIILKVKNKRALA